MIRWIFTRAGTRAGTLADFIVFVVIVFIVIEFIFSITSLTQNGKAFTSISSYHYQISNSTMILVTK